MRNEPAISSSFFARFSRCARTLLSFLPLAATVCLTLYCEMLWAAHALFDLFIPGFLWFALLLGWTGQQLARLLDKKPIGRKEWILPVSLLLVLFCGRTNIPTRLYFRTHKATLERLERGAPMPRANDDWGPVRQWPLQIAKSKGDTRFVLWDNGGNYYSRVVGFAHCPDDVGCRRASFSEYWEYGDRPSYVHLGHDWYIASLVGHDVD